VSGRFTLRELFCFFPISKSHLTLARITTQTWTHFTTKLFKLAMVSFLQPNVCSGRRYYFKRETEAKTQAKWIYHVQIRDGNQILYQDGVVYQQKRCKNRRLVSVARSRIGNWVQSQTFSKFFIKVGRCIRILNHPTM